MTYLKIDTKAVNVGAMSWAGIAMIAYDSIRWMNALKKHLDTAREGKPMAVAAAGKRARRQEDSSSIRSIIII